VHVLELDGIDWADPAVEVPPGPVMGVSRSPLPPAAAALLQRLTFTIAPDGPGRHWIDAPVPDLDDLPAEPMRLLHDLLPITATLPVPEALVVESLAYSTLLAGPVFRRWREHTPRRPVPDSSDPVLLTREDDVLTVTLNRPERHNAFGRAVRDGLLEALSVADLDPTIRSVMLTGNGPSFCSGGDLDEFGTTPDVVTAHVLRLDRSAGLAVHRLRDRTTALLHGACIGAGIEIPAFAGRVLAQHDAWFCLPELRFGLVPGAGGTVSITKRIGRWRTAYLVATGARLDLTTALRWGLVDGRA